MTSRPLTVTTERSHFVVTYFLMALMRRQAGLLQTGTVETISLDHDLGDDQHGTGYDVLLWIEQAVAERGFTPAEIGVHSANNSARRKMELAIESIHRFEQNQDSTRT